MTKLKFNIAHQVPGRVRMRIPAGKGNLELLQQTADTFAAIPGVERITINPATGSLVMHYDVDHHNDSTATSNVTLRLAVARPAPNSTIWRSESSRKRSFSRAIRKALARSWISSRSAIAI
mgnify:CR=1 FL=1